MGHAGVIRSCPLALLVANHPNVPNGAITLGLEESPIGSLLNLSSMLERSTAALVSSGPPQRPCRPRVSRRGGTRWIRYQCTIIATSPRSWAADPAGPFGPTSDPRFQLDNLGAHKKISLFKLIAISIQTIRGPLFSIVVN